MLFLVEIEQFWYGFRGDIEMAGLVGTSEGYGYPHNATKKSKIELRNPRKFTIRDTFWTNHVYMSIMFLKSFII